MVVVRATVRAGTTVDALTRLTAAWDRALLRTGLFEEFDASGPVLRAAPLEHTGRIYELP